MAFYSLFTLFFHPKNIRATIMRNFFFLLIKELKNPCGRFWLQIRPKGKLTVRMVSEFVKKETEKKTSFSRRC